MALARGIESLLSPTITPVIVLEGARTVGKTVVAHRMIEAGVFQAYEDLSLDATRELATTDPQGWLSSLPDRVVIDEAQLAPRLPLYLKSLVDVPGTRRRYLLTGSAALGRTSLGGSDPLTGRAVRRRLWPLTSAELNSRPNRMATLIDDLFSGAITAKRQHEDFDLMQVLQNGGFAPIALGDMSDREKDLWVTAARVGILTDHVLPDERFDAATAMRVLDGCLREPGGVLNITSLGQRLGITPRTVDRYLDVLERRFMVHYLPNNATGLARQTRARSKVHPIDTAFALESIRRGDPAKASDRRIIGHVLESWVVNQILPCVDLAPYEVSAFFWRDTGKDRNKPPERRNNEVDLVLVSGSNRAVGIEVKLTETVALSDAGGLMSLNAERPLDRGYVLYSGTKTIRLADRIYALPIAALFHDQ